MIAGIPLSFAEPLLLTGLLSLPVLWWLLRVMPPRRLRRKFLAVPPLRLGRTVAECRLAPLGA